MVRRAATEFVGTAFPLMAVVGSGIMGERLAAGNVAIALLANSVATGAALAALILALGPVSGAHFNPVVTLAEGLRGGIGWSDAAGYVLVQILGAFAGTGAAHLMFGLPLFFASHHQRSGGALLWSEFIATFGLLLVIAACPRARPSAVAFAVGAYIAAAYWFTAPRPLPIPRLRWRGPQATRLRESAQPTCPGSSWRKWAERWRLRCSGDG